MDHYTVTLIKASGQPEDNQFHVFHPKKFTETLKSFELDVKIEGRG